MFCLVRTTSVRHIAAGAVLVILLASCLPLQPATPPTSSPSSQPTASPQATSSPAPTPTPDPEYPLDENGYIIPQVLNYPVEVVAGSGKQGMGDGPALQAEFDEPQGLCTDPTSGVIYILDGNRVRKLTPDGQVQTVAGTAEPGFKNGLAQEARFDGPTRCEVDKQGTVYLIDQKRTQLRCISSESRITTLPQKADRPQMADLYDLAISPENILYFTNLFQIGRFQNNQLEILNDKQTSPHSRHDNPLFNEGDIQTGDVNFGHTLKIAFVSNGDLFITDFSNILLLKKSPDNQISIVFYNPSIPKEELAIYNGVLAINLVFDQARQKLFALNGRTIVELDLQGRPRLLVLDTSSKVVPDAAVGKDHHIYFIDAVTHQVKRLLLPPP